MTTENKQTPWGGWRTRITRQGWLCQALGKIERLAQWLGSRPVTSRLTPRQPALSIERFEERITPTVADIANLDAMRMPTVNTDLSVTGKVAQFGRGAMADISDKLLAQFVVNLNALIAEQPATSAPVPAASAPTEGVRTIESAEVAPLDLLSAAGSPILKRALPVVVVVVAVLVWLVVR